MDVLVTGATGYVGSAVAGALLAAGHGVSGLARSDESAVKLEERGIDAVRGDMTDAEVVAEAARGADAVVHAAAADDADAEDADRTTVEAVLDALRGTGRAFVYTSGGWVMGTTPEEIALADEETPIEPTPTLAWRPAVERLVLEAEEARTFVVRPALVYGAGGGVIEELVDWARERGSARYVAPSGKENISWTLIHRDDIGSLYARILESDAPGGTLLIATGDGPYRVREIAAAAGRTAGVNGETKAWPLEEAREELGAYADALALDQRLSGEKARRLFGWAPSAPSVFEELERGSYAADEK